MKTSLFALLFGCLALCTAPAKVPSMETPPAPPFKAAEAARLADDYVAKKFPEFPTLYCSEIAYDSTEEMKPDPTIVWRLRYFIPNNPRKDVPGSPFPDWGVCLVFVHKDKTVTHSIAPKRNPK